MRVVMADEGTSHYKPVTDPQRAVDALRELVAAGEPFIDDAFPGEQMTGQGLRLYNRWLAAMNDARTAEGQ